MRSSPQLWSGFARPLTLLAASFAVAAMMSGCASSVADRVPTAVGGLPEGTPPRPETPSAYPAVHDMPPPRTETVLTSEQQKQVEDELVAARERAAGAGATGSTGKGTGSTRSQ
jgi:hypothetical protein